jgi:uncharacterized membrane protein YdfJ with MMPL/SSD domain
VAIQDAITATPDVAVISPPLINDSGSAAIMNAVSAHAPSSDPTARLVSVLRADTLPPVTGENGVQAHVGGTTATYVDLARKIAGRMPIVVLTVLTLSFVFLMVVFRSLLVPVQASITNLLCVGAALARRPRSSVECSVIGLDPRGRCRYELSVDDVRGLFGLSMDYEVLPSAGCSEPPRSGSRTSDHRRGAAAGRDRGAVLFFVFASFIINGDPTIKQFGIGLATAVFLAGTMSVLLVPALLTLFGRHLFWLPASLGRILPHLDVEGGGSVGQPEASSVGR